MMTEHVPATLRERAGDAVEDLIDNAEAGVRVLVDEWRFRRARSRLARARDSIRVAVHRSSLIEHERRAAMLHTWASVEDALGKAATNATAGSTGRMLRILAEVERHRHRTRNGYHQRRPSFGADVEEAAGDALNALAQNTNSSNRPMQSLRALRVSSDLRPVLGTLATLVIHDVYPPEGSPR